MDQRRPASGATSSSSLDWAQGKWSAWAPGTQSKPKSQTQHNLSQFRVCIIPHELVPKTTESSLPSREGHSPLTVTADSSAASGLCPLHPNPAVPESPPQDLSHSVFPATDDGLCTPQESADKIQEVCEHDLERKKKEKKKRKLHLYLH